MRDAWQTPDRDTRHGVLYRIAQRAVHYLLRYRQLKLKDHKKNGLANL